MTHELKTWPQYFQAIKAGEKTFELRKNDRNFQVGDILHLREYKLLGLNPITLKIDGEYTGEELRVPVTYVLNAEPMKNNFGLEIGYCVMGIDIGWKAIAESNLHAYQELLGSNQE